MNARHCPRPHPNAPHPSVRTRFPARTDATNRSAPSLPPIAIAGVCVAIRGRVGDVVFKTHGDKIIVTRVPRFNGCTASAAQRERRDKMRAAVAFARAVYADPAAKALYVAAARQLGRHPFRLAVSDFLHGRNRLSSEAARGAETVRSQPLALTTPRRETGTGRRVEPGHSSLSRNVGGRMQRLKVTFNHGLKSFDSPMLGAPVRGRRILDETNRFARWPRCRGPAPSPRSSAFLQRLLGGRRRHRAPALSLPPQQRARRP